MNPTRPARPTGSPPLPGSDGTGTGPVRASRLPRAYLAELRGLVIGDPALTGHPLQPVAAAAGQHEGQHGDHGVRVTFLGVSTLLISDGRSAVMTDGFFTRPNAARAFAGRVRSSPRRVRDGLALAGVEARGGVSRLDAVLVTHSHYDHALDSAAVAARSGAWLVGSSSTAQIAAGQGFPQERFVHADPGVPQRYGDFVVTPVLSAHSPGDLVPGVVERPMRTPTPMKNYKTGECYSLLVQHGQRSLLVQASAGFIPGALQGHAAQTVYLGIGVLGKQSEAFREQYWQETVVAVGAKRVVPVHWDNLTRGLHRRMRPVPRPFDEVEACLRWLQPRAAADGVELLVPRLAQPADPWQP